MASEITVKLSSSPLQTRNLHLIEGTIAYSNVKGELTVRAQRDLGRDRAASLNLHFLLD